VALKFQANPAMCTIAKRKVSPNKKNPAGIAGLKKVENKTGVNLNFIRVTLLSF
jgi:hypothetical protein